MNIGHGALTVAKAVGRRGRSLFFEEKRIAVPTMPTLKGTQYFESWVRGELPYTNPDDLVGKKGLSIYREMMSRDDMVASCYAYLVYAALSSDWGIESADNAQPVDMEARDYTENNLRSMHGSFLQTQINILDALPIGFSVSEKVWAPIATEGRWRGKQGLSRIAHRNPVYIDLKPNEYGELEEDGIWQQRMEGSGGPYTKAMLDDVVYYVYDPRDDNCYGNSPSRRAYRWYFFKDGAVRLWARYMEKHGVPLIIGRYGQGAQSQDIEELRKYLRELRESLVAALREDWRVELVERKIGGDQLFDDAIKTCNRSIARGIGLPALVIESTETGAYSLGQAHADQFTWLLNVIRDGLTETINTQIVKPLVQHNFAVAEYPRFYLKPLGREDLVALSQVVKVLNEIGLPLSISWLRSTFSAPQPTDDAEDSLIGKEPGEGYKIKPANGEVIEPEAAESFTREFSELVWDAAHRCLVPRKVYSFGGNGETKAGRRLQTPIERHIDFDRINATDEEGERLTATHLGLILESIARDTELSYSSGKALRERPRM